ncbi:MAG: hypothetical protein WCX32_03355 [Clostridia bacterium]|jgi:hypothetical protein|nr:hypothetical protein [Clostridia bacterium]
MNRYTIEATKEMSFNQIVRLINKDIKQTFLGFDFVLKKSRLSGSTNMITMTLKSSQYNVLKDVKYLESVTQNCCNNDKLNLRGKYIAKRIFDLVKSYQIMRYSPAYDTAIPSFYFFVDIGTRNKDYILKNKCEEQQK